MLFAWSAWRCQQFLSDAENALMQLELEGRRPVSWIETTARRSWEREVAGVRRPSESPRRFGPREMTTSAEEHKYAYDERKALEKPSAVAAVRGEVQKVSVGDP